MPSQPIVIRPERPDHPQVRALLRDLDAYLGALYAPEENHILAERDLLAPEVSFLVAEQGEQIVGCGAVRRRAGEPQTGQRPYGEIKRMIVTPAARGQRIGECLLDAFEGLLHREGIAQALLETGGLQTAAVRLYERCGYQRRGAFGGYPDNGLSIFFQKVLAS